MNILKVGQNCLLAPNNMCVHKEKYATKVFYHPKMSIVWQVLFHISKSTDIVNINHFNT